MITDAAQLAHLLTDSRCEERVILVWHFCRGALAAPEQRHSRFLIA
jgi:hypothetical protein